MPFDDSVRIVCDECGASLNLGDEADAWGNYGDNIRAGDVDGWRKEKKQADIWAEAKWYCPTCWAERAARCVAENGEPAAQANHPELPDN